MGNESAISKLRSTANVKLDGLSNQTTIKELCDRVSTIKNKLMAEKPELCPMNTPTPKFLADNVELLHISDDRDALIFANGYVYYTAESSESVMRLEDCCKEFIDDPDFEGKLDPEKMSRQERKACTMSAELMQSLNWYLAITLLGDRRCRYNGSHSKGDRARVDNVVITDDGEELDFFEAYCVPGTEDGAAGAVINKDELNRLRNVAFGGFTENQIKIMDSILDGKSHDEIAAELGVKRGTVSTIAMRKRKASQAALLKDMKENDWVWDPVKDRLD